MADFVPFSGQLDGENPSQGGFVPFSGQLDSAQPAKERTFTEALLRQIGRTGMMGVQGVTSTGRALMDPVTGIANSILGGIERLGGPKTQRLTPPSQTLDALYKRLGLQSETPTEHVVEFLGTAGAGAADPALKATQTAIGKAFPAPSAQTLQAASKPLDDVTRELHEKGISLPPSRMSGTGPTLAIEGLAGKSQVAEELAMKNQPVFQAMVRKELGLPKDTPLTTEVLDTNVKQWIKRGYEPIEALPQHGNFKGIGIGAKFRQDLANLVGKYGGGDSFPAAQRNAVKAEVDKYLFDTNGRYLQSYSGEDAIRAIRNLRTEASANFSKGENILALTQKGIAKALEDNVELNLSRMPAKAGKRLLENFKQARVEIAKSEAVKDMLVDPSTGVISPQKGFSMLRSGTPLTGGLRVVANAGSPVYGPATRAPTQGAPLPIDLGSGGWMGSGALLGMLSGSPTMGAALAGVPLARSGARHLIASPWYQGKLAENIGAAPGYLMTPPGQRSIAAGGLDLLPMFTMGQQ